MNNSMTSKYNLSAEAKRKEADKLSKKINSAVAGEAAILVVLALLDASLFLAPITSVNYDSTPADIAFKTFFCAIAPIVLAAMAAHMTRKAQYAEGERRTASWVFAAVLLALTAFTLAVGWRLRANYYDDDTGVGLLLNIVAVVAAVIAFVADYAISQLVEQWKAMREEALIECDLLALFDYWSLYRNTSEIDQGRRNADDKAYAGLAERVVHAGIDFSLVARHTLARRIAHSPEEREHIEHTPFRCGPEDIIGDTSSELFEKAYAAVGAPSGAAITGEWGMPSVNTPFFDLEQSEKIAEYQRRFDEVRGLGPSESKTAETRIGEEPIPVQAEVVYAG